MALPSSESELVDRPRLGLTMLQGRKHRSVSALVPGEDTRRKINSMIRVGVRKAREEALAPAVKRLLESGGDIWLRRAMVRPPRVQVGDLFVSLEEARTLFAIHIVVFGAAVPALEQSVVRFMSSLPHDMSHGNEEKVLSGRRPGQRPRHQMATPSTRLAGPAKRTRTALAHLRQQVQCIDGQLELLHAQRSDLCAQIEQLCE
ncbi:uncharacterized protein BJ171DRAFT_535827 [Polychytrium aggregatum]|uniref:uncharacterized protein n=1 Tax=Polychytrium aggregatum TaxID=110093 RepID=UPI0022FDCA5C|nr:uncharacterized protein BJ171DRAFT_535827 [Polychytrium aggregatum]KAI9193016.1 hypothetical protein BJ171DRAFT_535827 [Polychytrium aggregatum]